MRNLLTFVVGIFLAVLLLMTAEYARLERELRQFETATTAYRLTARSVDRDTTTALTNPFAEPTIHVQKRFAPGRNVR